MTIRPERCGECERCLAPEDKDTVSCPYWLFVDYLWTGSKFLVVERAE